uniref:Transmembrane protein n=1 Tax=viral metagenome TaxID=1070528 RepID=A0A6C0BMW3_9ZZZZ
MPSDIESLTPMAVIDSEDDRSRLNVYIVFSGVIWIPCLILMNVVYKVASSPNELVGVIPLLFLMGLCTTSGAAVREITSNRSVSRRIVTILTVCQGIVLTSCIQTYLTVLRLYESKQ